MNTEQIAEIVRSAATDALKCYLGMCRLDSPWEVPEKFLASEAAKALADAGLRVAIEFKLDRASNCPRPDEINQFPARLQKAYAHLDVAILKPDRDPWKFTVDGIIEFKKHSSLADDATLIEFMVDAAEELHIMHGMLTFLVVGPSKEGVIREEKRLIATLPNAHRWRQPTESTEPEKYPPIGEIRMLAIDGGLFAA